MRRVLLGAVASALVFTFGCAPPDRGEDDAASQLDAVGEVGSSPGDTAMGLTPDRPDEVPLTVTMPAGGPGPDGIGRVAFPDVLPDSIFQRVDDLRIQYSVGNVPVDADGRFRFIIQ